MEKRNWEDLGQNNSETGFEVVRGKVVTVVKILLLVVTIVVEITL